MICYLGLGSNLGNREENILKARSELGSYLEILNISKIIETEPFGKKNQSKFLNCVLKIRTVLSPEELLFTCLNIEDQLGRERKEKWGPRNIDIDILFYGNEIINRSNLHIPHPELHKRKFVLQSLNEICPGFVHPVLKKTIEDIIREL